MEVKLALSTRGIVLIVVAVAIVEALILNPIRFHQTAQADGHSMPVPAFWKPVKNPDNGVAVAYQHEWSRLVGQASVAMAERGADSTSPWTTDAARKQLAYLGLLQSRNKDYSDPRYFDLSGNKFLSVCQETTVKGNEAMLCFVVGTRLQFSYLGSQRYEPVARKMLTSLH
jgi:hypothetical protein